ncbi:hypothetical protein CDCA_CDCA09G2793 [Cyanidium caldarium]|uniref:AB hydrolase-1 domain-containing protein n=1 Tax=Cyanidium caldarium TaxID=2771 RepID=A0AAV9IXE2_CYACA|nr:hypothetical protein CDCA_CDCA09G2793 [Cyanidium caldarium]|eukprot:ctg_393.g202
MIHRIRSKATEGGGTGWVTSPPPKGDVARASRWRGQSPPPRRAAHVPTSGGRCQRPVQHLFRMQQPPSESLFRLGSGCEVPVKAVQAIEDRDALHWLERVRGWGGTTGADGATVRGSYVASARWPLDDHRAPAIVLLHGFDSSVLEFRRLLPALERHLPPRVRLCAVDVLGWGFGSYTRGLDYSSEGKREHLRQFLAQMLGIDRGDAAPITLAGASLGGAVMVDYVLNTRNLRPPLSVVFLDAQVFLDGGLFRYIVPPFDCLGIALLRSVWLRRLAIGYAFYDRARYATEDAVRVGRLHCLQHGWADAALAFLKSTGYSLSARMPEFAALGIPTLVLWGEQDAILPAAKNLRAFRGVYQLAGTSASLEVVTLSQCGHLPHLEKPDETAAAIAAHWRRCHAGAMAPTDRRPVDSGSEQRVHGAAEKEEGTG